MMKQRILFLFIAIMTTFVTLTAANNKKFTLVIDAGHGGRDVGACGAKSQEKNLTLKYALAFGQMVERNCPDVRVVYTRKTDVFLELWQRAEIANKQKADLFISVHINSVPKGHIARGFQTYTLGVGRVSHSGRGIVENLEVAKRENAVILIEKDYRQHYEGFDPNSPESNIMFEFIQDKNMEKSVELAKMMQRRVCAATGRQDMGAHQDNLAVLRLTSMPACLIELGFISTPDEENFMNSEEAHDRYARGIYQAFIDYKRKYDPNVTVPYKAEPQLEVNIPTVVPKNEAKESPKEKKRKGKEKKQPDVPAPVAADTVAVAAAASPQPAGPVAPVVADSTAAPVFKVQILASSTRLTSKDPQLKGQADAECYEEGGLYKYTVGASENYNEVNQLRKTLTDRFPQAFVIAFRNGQKMDVRQAIQEFRNRKDRK